MAKRACPHCGEQIQRAAKLCPACGKEVVPIAPTAWAQFIGGFVMIMAVCGAGTIALLKTCSVLQDIADAPPDPKVLAAKTEIENQALARQVIEESIDTPSTAKYLSSETIASQANWRMVHVVLDAQNAFGAMLRKSVCVTFFTEGTQVKWNRAAALEECSKPPSAEEIAAIKILNGWPAR